VFETYARSWLANRTKLRPRTRDEYRKLIDRYLIPAFGTLRLDEIDAAMVRKWHADLETRTGPTQQAHAYALLRTIMGTAVTDDLRREANPCRIDGAGQTKRARKIHPATLDELNTIAEKIRPEYSAAVLLAAWCGLRFGEVAALERGDVNVKDAKLHIRRAVTYVGGRSIVGPPKSDAGIRDVAIPPHVVPVLVAHLRSYTALGKDALLFPAPSGGHLRGDGALHESFHAARAAAGRPDLRFHDLRHTGATWAAHAGASLAELMRRLGHSTSHAAMLYQHATDERDKYIADQLSGIHASAGVVELKPRLARTEG
jgi:integrase